MSRAIRQMPQAIEAILRAWRSSPAINGCFADGFFLSGSVKIADSPREVVVCGASRTGDHLRVASARKRQPVSPAPPAREKARRRQDGGDDEAVSLLPAVIVPMSEEQLQKAAATLAELLLWAWEQEPDLRQVA